MAKSVGSSMRDNDISKIGHDAFPPPLPQGKTNRKKQSTVSSLSLGVTVNIYQNSHVKVATNLGLEIEFHRNYNVYVGLTNPGYQGRLQGLCGNYNGNPNDDFITRQNQLTGDPNVFADSWKIGNTCPKPQPPGPSPCQYNVELKHFAEVKFNTLKYIYRNIRKKAINISTNYRTILIGFNIQRKFH